MKAHPFELRKKIADAYDKGVGTKKDIAKHFGVSPYFVSKLLKQRRETGSLAPNPSHGGPPRVVDEDKLELLRTGTKQLPNATLRELSDYLAEHSGVRVHVSTICRALKRLNSVVPTSIRRRS